MAKNLKDVVIVGAVRTPIGKYKGIWAKHQAHELGAKVKLNIFALKINDRVLKCSLRYLLVYLVVVSTTSCK